MIYNKIYRPGERPATSGQYKEVLINFPGTLYESYGNVLFPRIITIDLYNSTPGSLDRCPPTQYPGRGWIKIYSGVGSIGLLE